jgi:hypothetical protein
MRTAEKLPVSGGNSIMGERGGKVTHCKSPVIIHIHLTIFG